MGDALEVGMMPARVYLASLVLAACGATTTRMRSDDATTQTHRRAGAHERAPSRPATSVYVGGVFWFDPMAWQVDPAEACADPLVDGRGVCSLLGPVREIHDLEGGVSLRSSEGLEPAAIAAHLRCHHDWVGLEAFHDAGGCPLYLAGVRLVVLAPAVLVLGLGPSLSTRRKDTAHEDPTAP